MDEFKPPEDQTPSSDEEKSRIPSLLLEEVDAKPVTPVAPKTDNSVEMAKGIKLIGCLHLAIFALVGLPFLTTVPKAGYGGGVWGFFFVLIMFMELLAFVQFLYVIPALIVTLIMKKKDMALGIVMAMGLTILLAGASFALCTVSISIGSSGMGQ